MAVSPIQSSGDVGCIVTMEEHETASRRERQRLRLQKRAEEWWRAGRGIFLETPDDDRGGYTDQVIQSLKFTPTDMIITNLPLHI